MLQAARVSLDNALLTDDISQNEGVHYVMCSASQKIVGLSVSQWLPCPLARWNLLFGMAILLNLVKNTGNIELFVMVF